MKKTQTLINSHTLTHTQTHTQTNTSKAYRLALGIPFHTSTLNTYYEAGVLPLKNFGKLACVKYIVRSSTVKNSNEKEIIIRSDMNFPNRAKMIRLNKTIMTYSSTLSKLLKSNILK